MSGKYVEGIGGGTEAQVVGRRILFVATDAKDLRIGQRLYIDGLLAGVDPPEGWQEWPSGEFERWVAHREPVKVTLWTHYLVSFQGMGPIIDRGKLVGEIKDASVREEIYEWHLGNLFVHRAREKAKDLANPNRSQSINWHAGFVTGWGNSLEFHRTYSARVNWINVYNPELKQMGMHIDLLTREDARKFSMIANVEDFFRRYRRDITAVLGLILVAVIVVSLGLR